MSNIHQGKATDGLLILAKIGSEQSRSWHSAVADFGIMMGDGFMDALLAPVPNKPYVQNKSRLQHGKSIIIDPNIIRKDERSLTLVFVLSGATQAEFKTRRALFYDLLYSGELYIKFGFDDSTPISTNDVFHLYYDGNSVQYGEDLTHRCCRISIKFVEANPNDRTDPIAS